MLCCLTDDDVMIGEVMCRAAIANIFDSGGDDEVC